MLFKAPEFTLKPKWEEEEMEEDLGEDEDEEEDYEDEEEEEDEEGLGPPGPANLGTTALFPRKAQPAQAFRGDGVPRALGGQERPGPGPAQTGGAHVAPQLQPPDHGDWTYEEQFKQLYELDGDPKRKEFLDDLFSFMQKRGTPVNRIPIMAKQVLDLFMLYVLVTEKGGLVEVINKKLWREITKGLNLPTSITSAAFTLRTQYMKYLYPYECEKRGLSNPNELQAAIDSNRREGRRQSFGGSLFAYSPGGAHGMLSSPKLPVSSLGLAASTNGSSITPAPKIKKEEDSAIPITVPGRLPVSLAGHPVVAAQAAAVQAAAAQAAVAAQAAALEQLREKLESAEPPEKKMALVADEQQRLMQRALQQNFLAMAAQLPMSIRINSQASESPQDSASWNLNRHQWQQQHQHVCRGSNGHHLHRAGPQGRPPSGLGPGSVARACHLAASGDAAPHALAPASCPGRALCRQPRAGGRTISGDRTPHPASSPCLLLLEDTRPRTATTPGGNPDF
ncbi:PREDICTED: AT-rich interactive domain-containing protein 3A [Rhinopithecus bieti]|uniref:AT-rich interactive domain-containing protein 3A n=1 Tax=Rhinopithecus bieti TaxID=61621 RepID=UPI00083BBB49|nr:PREDICTED: AT-rich interactive domain-containing protein 3A [Rhinopithecus bieti]